MLNPKHKALVFFPILFFLFTFIFNLSQIIPLLKEIKFYFEYCYSFSSFHFTIPLRPKPFYTCELCNFAPDNKTFIPNSSERDAILSFATNELTNLIPFIRSLRTSNSKCRFIVFSNHKALTKYSKNFYQIAEKCGVEFINIGTKSFTGLSAMYIRFVIYKYFLYRNKDKFDRVIFCDLFDTIVQHDPFTTNFTNMTFFAEEGFTIKNNKCNYYWLLDAFKIWDKYMVNSAIQFNDEIKKTIFDKNLINAGIQAGPIKSMIEMTELMSQMGDETTGEILVNDQSFFNILAYSGFFKFNFSTINSSEFLSTFGYFFGPKIDKININLTFGRIERDGIIPGIIHQYDRSFKILQAVLKVCPNNNNLKDYYRNKVGL